MEGKMTLTVLDQIARLAAERDRLKAALEWALGERDNFQTRKVGDGPYWWRIELRHRAALNPPKP
jgi:hypothetical protein